MRFTAGLSLLSLCVASTLWGASTMASPLHPALWPNPATQAPEGMEFFEGDMLFPANNSEDLQDHVLDGGWKESVGYSY